MPAHRRPWWCVAAAAALVTAACKSSTSPQAQLANPALLSAKLQTVSGVVTTPVFQSFGAIGTSPGSPAHVSTPAGALLGAAPIAPPPGARQPYADAPARLQALRTAAQAVGSGLNASVIPPTLLGTTYVWSVSTHAYVQDPSATPAAPSNGVRIILYAIDPITGQVVESPLTPVGFVDLLDESTTSPPVNKLHVIVKNGTPASPGPTTYADYTVSGTVTGSPATAFSATAKGFVSDGTRTLTFDASFSATQLNTPDPDAQIDVVWDLNNPVVHVELHETLVTPDSNNLTITIHFSVTYGTETVAVDGTVTVVVSPETITTNLTIKVNGEPYATITGTATATTNNIQVRHANGTALSADELNAVSDLFELPDHLAAAIDRLFHPVQHLMGA
jgi:hypothetical protein